MPLYELTEEAASDLEDIFRYTLREWGENQARKYANDLKQCFEAIAARQIVPRTFSPVYPEAFVFHCGHHYVFYLHPEGRAPRIFAVLHERMDMLARLKDRLG